MTGKKIKAAIGFKYSPELREAHIKPEKVILIPVPLIVPTIWLHFKVRRVGNYQIDRIVGKRQDEIHAVSVD
ncbi:hypothetical protein MPUCK001_27020 [Citrobacter koseri]|nr:hypothetical protein MPUCK001_27020 [Citrobacter koseri]